MFIEKKADWGGTSSYGARKKGWWVGPQLCSLRKLAFKKEEKATYKVIGEGL